MIANDEQHCANLEKEVAHLKGVLRKIYNHSEAAQTAVIEHYGLEDDQITGYVKRKQQKVKVRE